MRILQNIQLGIWTYYLKSQACHTKKASTQLTTWKLCSEVEFGTTKDKPCWLSVGRFEPATSPPQSLTPHLWREQSLDSFAVSRSRQVEKRNLVLDSKYSTFFIHQKKKKRNTITWILPGKTIHIELLEIFGISRLQT